MSLCAQGPVSVMSHSVILGLIKLSNYNTELADMASDAGAGHHAACTIGTKTRG